MMEKSTIQKSLDKYVGSLDADGILIVDESVEVPETIKAKKIYKLPIIDTARLKVGLPMVANIVSIGVIYEIMCKDIIKLDTIKSSIAGRVPKATIDKNIQAFEEGVNLVRGY